MTRPHLVDVSMFWSASGGVRRVLSSKHALLDARGAMRHTVFAPGAARDLGPAGVDAGGVPLPGSGGYRAVLGRAGAARRIEALQPDIVESADPYRLAWASLDAARRLDIPAVAFCHSNLPALAALAARWTGAPAARWVARRTRDYLVRLYAQFDRVLAPSETMAQQLRAWGVPRVERQPLGVDATVFRPAPRDDEFRARLLDHLALSPETRIVVYCGRFAPEKNLPLLAQAVQRLGPGHALLAMGTGPTPPRGAHVRTLPPESDPARVARLLSQADVFAHAGRQETFGLAALEAMACGTPVVVADAAGLGEMARGVGRAVASQRAEDWAEAIDASLHAGDTAGLAAAALERARAHDWPRVVAQFESHYRALMRSHAAGTSAVAPGAPQVSRA
jgi:alpha-1,6-mannosyltransferase